MSRQTDDDPIMANPEAVAEIAIRAFARGKAQALAENERRDVPSYGAENGRIVIHQPRCGQTTYSDHGRLDERSLAMHRLVAEKVQADPALLNKARDNLCRWQQMEGSPKLALAEWDQILSGPTDQIVQFLTERSERATRLRQSSPFAGVLSDAERKAIYESFSTRTYHPRREPFQGRG